MSDLYQEIILDQLRHPQYQGQLESPDRQVSELNASCGDQLAVAVKFGAADDSPLADLRWQGQGCAISTSTISLLAAKIHHQRLSPPQIMALTDQDLLQLLGLTSINPGRIKCMQLGLRALKKAVSSSP